MTTKEAGEYLGGISDARVRQYVAEGRLPLEKTGHIHTIPTEAVEKLKEELLTEAPRKRGPKPKALKKNL